ncbi:hypothetical protein YWIDRAFT_02970 [Streptomyces sp. SceaMP-e96]|uniref:PD-(D/E)XK nuclease domain-containing protein n=1 Tax=unclassified Streptomyces TaxID=2593676 RepID=UPI00082396FD|nr:MULTISPECIES: hypothetical protein [unclassified Streptomyces]MYT13628.1 hypothetical protein [Streptomyces sp. SID4951]SCK53107.1 hypothetical protein YWIDRAFT_02970 [Streptomyces sp. SceaMP-e96]
MESPGGVHQLGSLVEEVQRLEELGRLSQGEQAEEVELFVRELQERYARWYALALGALPSELRARFQGEYEGSYPIRPKIKHFMKNPREKWVLYTKVPRFLKGHGPWQYPVDSSFLEPLREQKRLLLLALGRVAAEAGVLGTLERLAGMSERLAQGLAIVRRESRGRPGFRLEDEYDLQRFLHALLVLHFADVRPEESTPSWAGGFYRIDFLLKRERVAVEAKMASSSLGAKKIRDQLVADIFGYRHYPEAAGLFAVIYDPARRIDNPRGFEEGMSSASPDFPVRVVVAGG